MRHVLGSWSTLYCFEKSIWAVKNTKSLSAFLRCFYPWQNSWLAIKLFRYQLFYFKKEKTLWTRGFWAKCEPCVFLHLGRWPDFTLISSARLLDALSSSVIGAGRQTCSVAPWSKRPLPTLQVDAAPPRFYFYMIYVFTKLFSTWII